MVVSGGAVDVRGQMPGRRVVHLIASAVPVCMWCDVLWWIDAAV